jgi:hypothetical protein
MALLPLKLTEFDPGNPFTGAEIFGFVQVGENRRNDLDAITAFITTEITGGTATLELIRDTIGTSLTDSGLVVVTVNDPGDTIDVGVPAAVASDLNTGTDTAKAVTSDALAGSTFGKAVFVLQVSDPNGSAITTGDGKAYFVCPEAINGMNLVKVEMGLTTVSSSGIPTVQIANVTQAADMLTTKLTVDANELHSSTAATAAVIDTNNDDVVTGDLLRVDNDVAGIGAKGQTVILTFQLP